MKPVNVIWWTRFAFALLASLISAYLSIQYSVSKAVPYIALIVAIILYLVTYMLFKYWVQVKIEALPKKRDLAIAGAFPYFIVWFAFWILFYTLAIKA